MARLPVLDALPEKLREADFFLSHLENEDRAFAVNYYFSAFASAARSVTFVLKATMGQQPGFRDWYDPRAERLRQDPLACMMMNQRNLIVHVGEGGVVGGTHRRHAKRPIFHFSEELIERFGIDSRDNDVVELCRRHMRAMVVLVDDCLKHYRPSLDPHVYLTPTWLRKHKLTPEDIEERKGFARGWTRLSGSAAEWEDRIRVLLSDEPPWPDISDIVKARVARKASRMER